MLSGAIEGVTGPRILPGITVLASTLQNSGSLVADGLMVSAYVLVLRIFWITLLYFAVPILLDMEMLSRFWARSSPYPDTNRLFSGRNRWVY